MADDAVQATTRVEVFGSSSVPIVFEVKHDDMKSAPISRMRVSNSVSEFPHADFEFKLSAESKEILAVKRNDKINLLYAEGNDPYRMFFSGEISELEFATSKHSDAKLIVQATSPFYRFCLQCLIDEDIKVRSGLRSVVGQLSEYCDIWGDIEIDEGIDDSLEIQFADQVPAIVLLRLIIMQKDLAVTCPVGDVLYIWDRKALLDRFAARGPVTVDQSKISSSRFRIY